MHILLFLTLCPFLSLLLTLQSFLGDFPRTGTSEQTQTVGTLPVLLLSQS